MIFFRRSSRKILFVVFFTTFFLFFLYNIIGYPILNIIFNYDGNFLTFANLKKQDDFVTNFTKKIRIFDTFMYNNEASQAYVRIWRYAPYVDYFIIIYCNQTHSGQPKPITFEPFTKEIEKYKDKIRIVQYTPGTLKHKYTKDKAWQLEKSQRDYAIPYLEQNFNMTSNDIITVSDCDEILTRRALRYIIAHPPETYYVAPGKTYFPYYFHYIGEWNISYVIRYKPKIRLSRYRLITNAHRGIRPEFGFYMVTHCSYCFPNISVYKNKFQSFAHTELNKEPYITPEWIFRSHYCHLYINQHNNIEEPIEDLEELFPPDERISYLWDPSFEYNISETKYTESDLPTLCPHPITRRYKVEHPLLKKHS